MAYHGKAEVNHSLAMLEEHIDVTCMCCVGNHTARSNNVGILCKIRLCNNRKKDRTACFVFIPVDEDAVAVLGILGVSGKKWGERSHLSEIYSQGLC